MLFQHKTKKHHHLHVPKKESGVVLVVALFIVALVATMAYVMMSRLSRDTDRTQLLVRNVAAEGYAQGALAWAIDTLRQDWDAQKPNQLIDVLPLQLPVKNIHGYQISATIYDMQARFNLNSLTAAKTQPYFLHLLKVLTPNLDEQQANELLHALFDWISKKDAHRLMQSVSELQLVKGMTPAIYKTLQPYVTVLPVVTPINVQTADVAVLATLSPTMDVASAKLISLTREQKPFTSLQIFLDLDVVKNHGIKEDNLTVVSNYFLVETKVSIEKQQMLLYTLLERSNEARKSSVRIVWQSKGVRA